MNYDYEEIVDYVEIEYKGRKYGMDIIQKEDTQYIQDIEEELREEESDITEEELTEAFHGAEAIIIEHSDPYYVEEDENLNKLKRNELMNKLDNLGIRYKKNFKKDKLIELLLDGNDKYDYDSLPKDEKEIILNLLIEKYDNSLLNNKNNNEN